MFLLLNPVMWKAPVEVAVKLIQARERLASEQASNDTVAAVQTPVQRATALLAQLYFTSPRIAETANYLHATQASQDLYMANPLNSLMRNILGGGVYLILTIFGFLAACIHALRPGEDKPVALIIWIAASILLTAILLVTVPISWQRYYLPLVPFTCLWIAYGLDTLRKNVKYPSRAM